MAIYSILAEREKVGSRKVIGMVIALAGILTLTFQGNQTLTALGVILMLITGVSWGVYSVWGRRLADPFGYTFYSFLIVTLIAVPPQTIFGAREILEIPFSLAGWGLILYFGMISTAFSYVLWHKALRRLRASQGGIYQMLVPVIAAAMGIILLSEQLALSLVVGGGLIVLGIYLNR
jgi:drug/metabolite transporter (DMT)-like permease